MLAANIDDMTGEAFGYLMERLMAEGALDVSFVPLTMKKSRPGLMAQVVARVEDEEKLGNLLLNESTTLGVRISHMRRMMQKRRFERVSTEYGEITVKIAEGTGRACPEYEQAAALARRWGAGYEITAFCYAPMLDTPETARQVRRDMEGVDRFWFHAPFAELIPCAIDPLVRQTAQHRFRQTLAAAQKLGIRQVVLHGGFIPHVYFPEWYVEQSVLFWRDFLQEVPPDFVLALENVMEPSPDTLVSIAAGVDDPRLGLCLDVGHANTCVSRTPPLDWIAPMAPYLRHVHLHNNRGQEDLHAPLDEGTVPMGEIIGAVLERSPRATFTIENQDALPSLRWLAQQGYIEDIL